MGATRGSRCRAGGPGSFWPGPACPSRWQCSQRGGRGEVRARSASFAFLALFRSSLGLFLLEATTWGMRQEEGLEPAVQGASRRRGRRALG